MGLDYTTYVGPIVRCYDLKDGDVIDTDTVIVGQVCEACSKVPLDPEAQFCSACGSAIVDETQVTYQTDLDDAHDLVNQIEDLIEVAHHLEMDGPIYIPNLTGIGHSFDPKYESWFMPIPTLNETELEVEKFYRKFEESIGLLELIYERVEVSYVMLHYIW